MQQTSSIDGDEMQLDTFNAFSDQYVAKLMSLRKFWLPGFTTCSAADLLKCVAWSRLEVCFNKSQLDQRLIGEICIDLWPGLEMFFSTFFLFIYLVII